MWQEAIEKAVSFLISQRQTNSSAPSVFQLASTPPAECIAGASKTSGVDWFKWLYFPDDESFHYFEILVCIEVVVGIFVALCLKLNLHYPHDSERPFNVSALQHLPPLVSPPPIRSSQEYDERRTSNLQLFESTPHQALSFLLASRESGNSLGSVLRANRSHGPDPLRRRRLPGTHSLPSNGVYVNSTRHTATQRISLPQRLVSARSGNGTRPHSTTESNYSVVSSMLCITTSQCASPSFGPISLPRSERNTSSTTQMTSLSIVGKEIYSGHAPILQDIASSEPLPDPEDIPTRRPRCKNGVFDPQVLSYDLEQESRQDAPILGGCFASDRDITPEEWSTLRAHVLALWAGKGSLTRAGNAEMEMQTRVDEWNTRFFSSRGMLLVLFAGNIAKGGSLSGFKETRIAFKTICDQEPFSEEENVVIIDSADRSEASVKPSWIRNRSRIPYALVMYDLHHTHLPLAIQDARVSQAPGCSLPCMVSKSAPTPLPNASNNVPNNAPTESYRETNVTTKHTGEMAAPISSTVPLTARANAEHIFYSLLTDRTRLCWEVDVNLALPDSGIALVDHALQPFLESIFWTMFYQENHLEPRLGSQTGRRLVKPTLSLSSALSRNVAAMLRLVDDPSSDRSNPSIYSVLYRLESENISEPCYYCYICMLQFPRSSMDDMLGHIREHLGHRPYVCNCRRCTSKTRASHFYSEKALIRHQEETRRIAVGRQDFQSGPNAYSMRKFEEVLE